MRTIIEVAIGNITIFSAKYSRRLADKEIHKVVREGCIGIDRSKAVITIKYEYAYERVNRYPVGIESSQGAV